MLPPFQDISILFLEKEIQYWSWIANEVSYAKRAVFLKNLYFFYFKYIPERIKKINSTSEKVGDRNLAIIDSL